MNKPEYPQLGEIYTFIIPESLDVETEGGFSSNAVLSNRKPVVVLRILKGGYYRVASVDKPYITFIAHETELHEI